MTFHEPTFNSHSSYTHHWSMQPTASCSSSDPPKHHGCLIDVRWWRLPSRTPRTTHIASIASSSTKGNQQSIKLCIAKEARSFAEQTLCEREIKTTNLNLIKTHYCKPSSPRCHPLELAFQMRNYPVTLSSIPSCSVVRGSPRPGPHADAQVVDMVVVAMVALAMVALAMVALAMVAVGRREPLEIGLPKRRVTATGASEKQKWMGFKGSPIEEFLPCWKRGTLESTQALCKMWAPLHVSPPCRSQIDHKPQVPSRQRRVLHSISAKEYSVQAACPSKNTNTPVQ